MVSELDERSKKELEEYLRTLFALAASLVATAPNDWSRDYFGSIAAGLQRQVTALASAVRAGRPIDELSSLNWDVKQTLRAIGAASGKGEIPISKQAYRLWDRAYDLSSLVQKRDRRGPRRSKQSAGTKEPEDGSGGGRSTDS